MLNCKIFSRFALIGEDLELKQNVRLEINHEGKIINISCENVENGIDILLEGENFVLIPGLINSHVHIGDNFAKELGFNKSLIEVVEPPNGLKHELLAETPNKIKVKGIRNAILEMLSNGITSFIDFREGGIDGISLLNKAVQPFPVSYLALGRFSNKNEIKSVIKSADGIGLANYSMISNDIKEKLKEFKSKYKKLIACHIGIFMVLQHRLIFIIVG